MPLNHFRDYFIFTGKERNGIILLLILLFLAVCLDIALPYLIPDKEYDTTAWNAEAEKYLANPPISKEPDKELPVGFFDPNYPVATDLVKIGLPEGVAANWIKYLQRGGQFRKKEDVRKLYGMTANLYAQVEGHLKMQDKVEPVKPNKEPFIPKKSMPGLAGRKEASYGDRGTEEQRIQLLEINLADSAQLESLPGIGPVLASRIIKYRKLLGGFYEVAQLKEIYGMTEELWAKSSTRLLAEPSGIKKLELNFLSVAELGKHPYIGFRQAKRIVKRRDTVGKFTHSEELASLFSPDSLQHLLPYVLISGEEP